MSRERLAVSANAVEGADQTRLVALLQILLEDDAGEEDGDELTG